MRWFGFGFNAFGQINGEKLAEGACSGVEQEVKTTSPAELSSQEDGRVCKIRACWSRTASLYLGRFGTSSESRRVTEKSRGCHDASIGEAYLTLAFPDRLECWDLQKEEDSPSWSMEIAVEGSGPTLNLPLVPGGYIGTKPPFYRSLSPHLKAKSLALSAEHAVLLSASGAVYTWGLGSHGQLGHGALTPEEEPRAVEALWGMPMSCVATGSWHSVCISDGGDLYVWGWNESGQLGLPSRGLRKPLQQQGAPCQKTSPPLTEEPQDGKCEEVFISIQAFPALLDVSPSCELMAVSCGSRHTAAVTTTGDLYTWGWGEYGQLGHQSLMSTDEPQCVQFFREQHMRVIDVVCGPWNTFAAVIKEEA